MWVSSGVATRKVRRETQKARDLRGRQTPEEQMLWRALRNRFLTLKFRRQQPIGPYIADFVCYEAHLVIELDGSQHAEEAARAYDAVRTEFLEAGGFKVLRFWNNEVRFNLEGVLEVIQTHLP
ncbi:endonuclease domain-containing protein [Deinococcus sp. YIM 134068]